MKPTYVPILSTCSPPWLPRVEPTSQIDPFCKTPDIDRNKQVCLEKANGALVLQLGLLVASVSFSKVFQRSCWWQSATDVFIQSFFNSAVSYTEWWVVTGEVVVDLKGIEENKEIKRKLQSDYDGQITQGYFRNRKGFFF